jgi:hypothetical protein
MLKMKKQNLKGFVFSFLFTIFTLKPTKNMNTYNKYLDVKKEASEFWKSDANPLDQRIELFNQFGDRVEHNYNNPFNIPDFIIEMKRIIDDELYNIDGNFYATFYTEIIHLINIIDVYILQMLCDGESKLVLNDSDYGTKYVRVDRVYIPSEATIQRYRNYFINKLLKQDISCIIS